MKVIKHTEITLSKEECLKVIAFHLNAKGYTVKPENLDALISSEGVYDIPKFAGIRARCQFEEEDN